MPNTIPSLSCRYKSRSSYRCYRDVNQAALYNSALFKRALELGAGVLKATKIIVYVRVTCTAAANQSFGSALVFRRLIQRELCSSYRVRERWASMTLRIAPWMGTRTVVEGSNKLEWCALRDDAVSAPSAIKLWIHLLPCACAFDRAALTHLARLQSNLVMICVCIKMAEPPPTQHLIEPIRCIPTWKVMSHTHSLAGWLLVLYLFIQR